MRVPTQNSLSYTLDAQLAAGANSLTLNQSVDGVIRAPGVGWVDRIDTSGGLTPTKREYFTFTGVSGAQLTGLSRGLAGSTDQVHAVGAIVEFGPDVLYEQNTYDYLTLEHTTDGVHASLPSLTQIRSLNGIFASTASAQLVNTRNLVVASQASIAQLNVGTLFSVSGASVVGLSTSGAFRPFFQVPGGLSSLTNIGGLIPVDGSYTISNLNAFVQTPSSVASVSILLKKNLGTTIGVICIPAGATFASSASISTAALVASDNLGIDINSTASLAADLSLLVRAV